jgi:hypothetical protein
VRHHNKYAAGQVSEDRRFEFRDQRERFDADAGNIGELIDALRRAPWSVVDHHAKHEDFSRWIHDVLGDEALATAVRAVERSVAAGADPSTGRDTLVAPLEHRYLRR